MSAIGVSRFAPQVWYAKALAEVPVVPAEKADDCEWRPLQHHFRLTAFGANAYSAGERGQGLLDEHDETGSGQEELYLVIAGAALFTLGDEHVEARAPFVVAVPGPAVVRSAVALEPATTVLAFGGERRESFRSSWEERHFSSVPQA